MAKTIVMKKSKAVSIVKKGKSRFGYTDTSCHAKKYDIWNEKINWFLFFMDIPQFRIHRNEFNSEEFLMLYTQK